VLLAQNEDFNAGPAWLGLGLFCVFGVLTLLATVFWLWMLIDALVSEPTASPPRLTNHPHEVRGDRARATGAGGKTVGREQPAGMARPSRR
jgi:hypothetical protein